MPVPFNPFTPGIDGLRNGRRCKIRLPLASQTSNMFNGFDLRTFVRVRNAQ